jgi:hypothetical protein
MDRACTAHGEEEEYIYRILLDNPEGKRQLRRSRRGWEDNIQYNGSEK